MHAELGRVRVHAELGRSDRTVCARTFAVAATYTQATFAITLQSHGMRAERSAILHPAGDQERCRARQPSLLPASDQERRGCNRPPGGHDSTCDLESTRCLVRRSSCERCRRGRAHSSPVGLPNRSRCSGSTAAAPFRRFHLTRLERRFPALAVLLGRPAVSCKPSTGSRCLLTHRRASFGPRADTVVGPRLRRLHRHGPYSSTRPPLPFKQRTTAVNRPTHAKYHASQRLAGECALSIRSSFDSA